MSIILKGKRLKKFDSDSKKIVIFESRTRNCIFAFKNRSYFAELREAKYPFEKAKAFLV